MSDFDALLSGAYENTVDTDTLRGVEQSETTTTVASLTNQSEFQYAPAVKLPTVEYATGSAVTGKTWEQITSTPEFIGTVSAMAACGFAMVALWLNE